MFIDKDAEVLKLWDQVLAVAMLEIVAQDNANEARKAGAMMSWSNWDREVERNQSELKVLVAGLEFESQHWMNETYANWVATKGDVYLMCPTPGCSPVPFIVSLVDIETLGGYVECPFCGGFCVLRPACSKCHQHPAGHDSMGGTCGPCYDPYQGAGYEAHLDLAAESGWVPCGDCANWAPKDEMIVIDGYHLCHECAPFYKGEKRVCPECKRGIVVADGWVFYGDVCDECATRDVRKGTA